MTSQQMILKALKESRPVNTSLECRARFQVLNLPDVIYRLKAKGHDIKTDLVDYIRLDGRVVKVAEYWL